MSKRHYLSILLATAAVTMQGFVIDWDKIEHWAGEGPNKAALVVQFSDNGPQYAYVWGYRWEDGETPSGEDMFRAVAKAAGDLTLFTQYTGWMGNTVCGVGYSDGHTISDFIEFDFDGAQADPRISFNWFSANTMLGQTSVPGWDTQELCDEAIVLSKDAHILDHPINAREYGYACYDYDWWQPYGRTDVANQRWQAGWYDGYWSYWVGGVDSEYFSYSGLGMTSRKLNNLDVDAWKYLFLDGPVVYRKPHRLMQNVSRSDVDGYTGATPDWYELDYSHFRSSDVKVPEAAESGMAEVFDLKGVSFGQIPASSTLTELADRLPAGVYLLKSGPVIRKIIVR